APSTMPRPGAIGTLRPLSTSNTRFATTSFLRSGRGIVGAEPGTLEPQNPRTPEPQNRRTPMPQLTVEHLGTFDITQGKRLVLALEEDARIDQLHACGGRARCTTCRVEFISGEPPTMTKAEQSVLAAKGLI